MTTKALAPAAEANGRTVSLTPFLRPLGKKLIHLAFFDGIGVAELALENLVGAPLAYLSWEICEDCICLLSKNFPHVVHRGDFQQENPSALAAYIQDLDPAGEAIIILSGGPPCHDFSGIKDTAKGRAGTEGVKFVQFADFVAKLEPMVKPRDILPLIENVVMQNPGDIHYFSNAVQAQPTLLDPADFTIISRPRLFWTRLRWCDLQTCPLTGKQLRWSKVNKIPKLHVDLPVESAACFDTQGLQFHDKVVDGSCKLPCLTTPAPTAEGRPPPRKMRGRLAPEVKSRWLQDQRCYAPWHYNDTAMLRTQEGDLVTPPAFLKEQLQGLPVGFTSHENIAERSRHRVLANAWHFQVAKFLMLLLLQHRGTMASPCPMPRTNALQFVLSVASTDPPLLGANTWASCGSTKVPTHNMWDHWAATDNVQHPLFGPSTIEPGITQVIKRWTQVGDIARMRAEVIVELFALVESFKDKTSQWQLSLPQHVTKVYQQHGDMVQVPVMIWLLQALRYPGIDILESELSNGFPTTGRLSPGAGWQPRLDARYSHPISRETFEAVNQAYVTRKMRSKRLDPHWQVMLNEILEEHAQGRLEGPFELPVEWPAECGNFPPLQTLPRPSGKVLAAGCFAVEQSDKIRRCEDHRRSGLNATVEVFDSPIHHNLDDYVATAKFLAELHIPCHAWGHDMAAAYRQLPVQNPEECYTFLHTPSGVGLFRHNALSFGAVASVWSFNRVADVLTTICRSLLWCPVLHFVDDFGATEPDHLARSGFEAFSELLRALGFRTKLKKAQPPACKQKLLGVFLDLHEAGAHLHPCPDRVQRIVHTIQSHLTENHMTPEQAQVLAGKLTFLQTTSFGRSGLAMLTPLYGRAHLFQDHMEDNNKLSHALRASLSTLAKLLPDMQPRYVPFAQNEPISVVYTDAFFQMGERLFRPSDPNIPRRWNSHKAPAYHNGWGIIVKTNGRVYYSSGSVPAEVLRLFCKRRAYIYVLEVLAQIFAFVIFHSVLTPYVVSYIDNEPGRCALSKGYGKDLGVNNLLSFAWTWLCRAQRHPHFEWIPSDQNISDPVSRFDSSVVQPDWVEVCPDMNSLWPILIKASKNLDYATSGAVKDCLDLFADFSRVHGGRKSPRVAFALGSSGPLEAS